EGLYPNALMAARAALAAGEQRSGFFAKESSFWKMQRRLFENQAHLAREDVMRYAAEIGLDVKRFQSDLDSQVVADQIRADQELAKRFGAVGTPAFFINGRSIHGLQAFAGFKRTIDEEIAKADSYLQKVSIDQLYEALTGDGLDKWEDATASAAATAA